MYPASEAVKDVPKTGGRYVPPQLRNQKTQADASVSGASRLGARSKKFAPNVNSQEDFPTLGSAPEPMYVVFSLFVFLLHAFLSLF